MAGLHTWAGLLLGWLLYAIFVTGTVSYFRDEISQWMRPEVARLRSAPDQAALAQRVADALETQAAGSAQWSIRLPTERSNVATAFWRTPGEPTRQSAIFDPATGKQLVVRDTIGGTLFHRFHYEFYYLPAPSGRWLAGLCAMFMFVAIISGVITHKKIFADFFTFRWGKGQRSWLDAHGAFSVFGLPFYLMIAYTGLVMHMTTYMPWGALAALKTPAQQHALAAQLNAAVRPGKSEHIAVPLARVDAMVRAAQLRWGTNNVSRVTVTNPGDASARVAVSRGDVARVSLSPQYLLFDGATGRLLEVKESVGAAAETRGVLAALHRGRFSDLPLRWLYFSLGLGGTAMIGTGLVMWTVKRRQRLPDPERPYFGFRLVERLNVAVIAGLPVAMASYLWANRLLPVSMAHRADAEINVFFAVWGATLLYALVRPAKRAWIGLLWCAATLLALVPVVNALTTTRPFWRSVATGDWVYAGFDLAMWAFAALHAALAWRAARHRPRVRTTHARVAVSQSQDA